MRCVFKTVYPDFASTNPTMVASCVATTGLIYMSGRQHYQARLSTAQFCRDLGVYVLRAVLFGKLLRLLSLEVKQNQIAVQQQPISVIKSNIWRTRLDNGQHNRFVGGTWGRNANNYLNDRCLALSMSTLEKAA